MTAKKKPSKKSARTSRPTTTAQPKPGHLDAARAAAPAKSKTTPAGAAKKSGNAKATAPTKAVKPAKASKAAKSPPAKRVSALDAAAQVIASAKKPMRAVEMVTQMAAKGLWKSPGGKTPEATLYAAIIREIAAKGKDARFVKHDRGLFIAGKVA